MDQWKVWLSETQNLQELQLPRHHPEFTSKSSDVQIHTFCDASESAFGAVSYLRYQDDNGKIQCSFLASKTRVAPLKSLSIPRLELQGAVLASRLSQTLEKELKLNVTHQVYWTDSEVVLKYLRNETKRFKPFVANCIAEIMDVTSKEDWHHVYSENNPADRCSRGMKASALVSDQLWYKGPTFLHTVIQKIACLKANQPTDKGSKLLALTPFYDHSIEYLRVGGRISHASVPDDAKFQLILPAEHAITGLIATEVHCRLHHGGQEHMIAELRQKYSPLRARCVVKRTIRKCLICQRQRILPKVPIMADLPQCRLNVSHGPFACCGVDYWGPMLVKERR
ncbi:uncharacterized protein LOC106162014 [Lingula anatina]|uniref:Uncharacterized protein LOC106162014 n=1 Tax=Lingula anatina TaxID=7574 RepID=A0A1S3I8Q0_LINAN|nr:uncharacterized protein LOC106162014 [Lingula anatina]|eukprot:XP_013394568.1 uncharacterized protein LOC106162014 [Lingula anatina]